MGDKAEKKSYTVVCQEMNSIAGGKIFLPYFGKIFLPKPNHPYHTPFKSQMVDP